MRVLLVRPPIYSRTLRFPAGPRFGLPTSLLYLAAVLERACIDVKIYDALIDFTWHDMKPDKNGNYLVGPPWDVFASKVLEYRPDLVGITNPFSDFAPYSIRAALEIKKRDAQIITVVGGPHATSAPESFLSKESPVDYVVRGEGETTIVKLALALSANRSVHQLLGISYRNGTQVRSNPPAPFIERLDDLPLPAYHLVPMEKYFELVKAGFPSRYSFDYEGSEREVSLITSRGCPYRCIFCGNHLHMGRRWRFHSATYVLRHMKFLIERYGVKHFHLEDDNITLRTDRFEGILDGIMQNGWPITWDTPNGIRADGLSPALLKKIKESGCTYLCIGIESGDQHVLDNIIRKGLDLKSVVETVATCKMRRIDMHAFYMIGFPGEELDQIYSTFRFARRALWRYDVIPHVALARPLPGTELYRICQASGYLTEPVRPAIDGGWRSEVYQRIMIKTQAFSPADLDRLVTHFDREVAAMIVFKVAMWLCAHPVILKNAIMRFLQLVGQGLFLAVKRVFFGGLFFKFNYLNERLIGAARQSSGSRSRKLTA